MIARVTNDATATPRATLTTELTSYMMQETLKEIYDHYRIAPRVRLEASLVQPGDLYIAYPYNRPLHPLGRLLWDVLETVSQPVLRWLLSLARRFRLSIWLNDKRAGANADAQLAIARGASYAVIDNVFYKRSSQYLLVKNVRETLAELGSYHRQQLNIPLMAITGSNGKTTTKELVIRVLSTQYRVAATTESHNSLQGVVNTILSAPSDSELIVLEMGITKLGELAKLCNIAQPTLGLITSIGEAHLSELHTIEGVQAAKGELFDYLRATVGRIFVNLNDERVSQLARNYERVFSYGSQDYAELRGEVLRADPLLCVRWRVAAGEYLDVQTQLAGAYNLDNVLAAIAVGVYHGIPPDSIATAIEGYQPLPNRSQLIQLGSNKIILDAHNANPSSMAAALRNLAQLPDTRKVAVLGDMLDLGRQSKRAHAQVVHDLRHYGIDSHVLVGREFHRVRDAGGGVYLSSARKARQWLLAQGFENSTILIKGSRCMQMETILETDS